MQEMKPPVPPWAMDENRIDINLIAMLLWQSLLVGTAVGVSHLGWYLPDASAGELGLQFGLICFGFLCLSMVLFHVGGLRDSLAMRAEFAQESRYDKWQTQQARLQARRMRKYSNNQDFYNGNYGQQQSTTFTVPVQTEESKKEPEHQ